ncbi:MAG: ABC transporter ATP-binding protein [Patescibacteria group bacterium]|jgi:putative ABC transport system ATP-binding protein
MPSKNNIIIKVENLDKTFDVVGEPVEVLKKVSFEINTGEFAIIYGPSGCGKSTLLHSILGLEKPTSGIVNILGTVLYQNHTEDDLSDFRKNHVGMVYQQANWVKAINVVENVALPLALHGEDKPTRIEKAKEVLKTVHMLDWALYHPAELSSGQQQRVSLARALITNPDIIIADEPTGNLDYEAGQELMQLLMKLTQETQKTILMVTHELDYLKYADRAIHLFDGQVSNVFNPKTNPSELNNIFKKRSPNAAQIKQ